MVKKYDLRWFFSRYRLQRLLFRWHSNALYVIQELAFLAFKWAVVQFNQLSLRISRHEFGKNVFKRNSAKIRLQIFIVQSLAIYSYSNFPWMPSYEHVGYKISQRIISWCRTRISSQTSQKSKVMNMGRAFTSKSLKLKSATKENFQLQC